MGLWLWRPLAMAAPGYGGPSHEPQKYPILDFLFHLIFFTSHIGHAYDFCWCSCVAITFAIGEKHFEEEQCLLFFVSPVAATLRVVDVVQVFQWHQCQLLILAAEQRLECCWVPMDTVSKLPKPSQELRRLCRHSAHRVITVILEHLNMEKWLRASFSVPYITK